MKIKTLLKTQDFVLLNHMAGKLFGFFHISFQIIFYMKPS